MTSLILSFFFKVVLAILGLLSFQVSFRINLQGDLELQTPSKETALQERRSGSRGREGHRRSLPREPHISQDTARHVGRDSLPFVNCWKLVVWILL